MEDLRSYKAFWKAAHAVLARVPSQPAPARLVEDTMRRVLSPEPRPLRWAPRAALALAGVAAVFLVWRQTRGAPEPVIVSFTADKTNVRLGEPITLSWEVLHAKKVLIKDDHGMVTDPGDEKSIKMYHMQPGEYTFVLIAMGSRDGAIREFRAH